MKKTSAELKRMARESLQGHWGIMIGVFVLEALIIYAAIILFSVPYVLTRSLTTLLIYSVVTLVVSLGYMVLQTGVISMHLKLARDQEVSLGMLFSQFSNRPFRYILGSLLLGVIGVGCMLPGYICIIAGRLTVQVFLLVLGILLLIAGTVIYIILAFRYALIMYLFIEDSQIKVMEAYRESARFMQGNKGRMFYISLSFIGWSILAMFSCGIGMLWVTPYMSQTMVQFYLDVKGSSETE